MNFNDMNFDDRLKSALSKMKYVKATEVQEKTIPLMIDNENVICKSFTGSGKTIAFGIPAIDLLLNNKTKGVLIIGPTRELVVQVKEELRKIAKHTNIKIIAVYGGHGIALEMKDLKRGVDILVATPGRLKDHFERHSINPKHFDTVILDEADRMLDMGFLPDIKEVLKLVKPNKMHLFSATLEKKVALLIREFMPKYKEVKIKDQILGKNIIEKDIRTSNKFREVMNIIKNAQNKKVLIFVSTKRYADTLTEKLVKKGLKAKAIHGDKSQKSREYALNDFKKGKVQILIATDVAARGLQVDDIEYVINYDPARDKDTHKHRIGRTGRMNKKGYAINLIATTDRQNKALQNFYGSYRRK